MATVPEIITSNIIKALEAGTVPWRKPWRTSGDAPTNLVSKKAYRGINVFLLGFQNYGSPYWLTRKQCADRGGRIRKGEHGTPIIFYRNLESKTETNKNGKPKSFFMMRYYLVWNVEQCEGIDYPMPVLIDHDPIPVCEAVVNDWTGKPTINHGGGRASYSDKSDRVDMPEIGRFDNPEGYYATLFHELGHATGHESRLDRNMTGNFGSSSYSVEELVAEMTAAMLCGHCGIDSKTIENSAAYIQTWLGRLKKDSKLVFTAASKAQKASDMILDNVTTFNMPEVGACPVVTAA